MKKKILTGLTFGKLTVGVEVEKTPAGHTRWMCKCECGNEVIRTSTTLLRSTHSSCGCWSRVRADHPLFKGCGEISASWFYNVIQRAASGRKSRSKLTKKLDIDIKYIWELFLKQNRRCSLSGIVLTFPKNGTAKAMTESTASLDRIDSKKGYVKGNVQWIHKHINIMKNTFDQDYFVEMCKLIAGGSCELTY